MSLRPAVVLVLALASSSALPACDGGSGERGDAWAGEVLDPPVPRPDALLTDMDGEPYGIRAETAGDAVLLFFGYTHCPDVCPVHMANLAEVLRDLPLEVSRRIRVLFVTTDPARDTPERLREWLGALHPAFVGLRGTREEVNALEERLGLPPSVVRTSEDPADYFVGHAGQVLAFGPDGPARIAYPWGTRQRDWLRDLPRLVEGDAGLPED